MRPRRIDLSIDELVLDGFGLVDRERIRAEVESELGRLLGEGGIPDALVAGNQDARDRISRAGPQLTPGKMPGAGQIARAIYGAMRR